MGNITILDMLGSALIAGFLLFIVYTASARMDETLFTTGNDLVVQEQLVGLVETIEKDFRRIGYCADQRKIPDQSKAVVAAGPNAFSFLTDVEGDGVVDTLTYSTGTADALTLTYNPRDRMLYRSVNGEDPIGMNIGLTRFDLKYFDVNDDSLHAPVADPSLIHNMELSIQVESTLPYDDTYAYAAWRQIRMRTRNLNNR